MAQALPSLLPFGSARGALAVDFDAELAPQVVTAVLAACASGEVGDEELWALPVGTRIQRLLSILGLEGGATLWVQIRCRHEGCGEPIEVDLAPAEFVALAGQAGRATWARL